MHRRLNGFERPFTNDQMLSWVCEPVAAVIFYLIVSPFAFDEVRIALLTVHSVLLAAHVACWLYCSLTDPGVDSGCPWPCMAESQKEVRYCSVCNKQVPGLDHHCTWLNTCIGKRQYPAFFALVTIGTFMFWFEAVMFICLLTVWRTPETEAKAVEILGSLVTYKVLLSLATCFAAGLACSLSILFVFHMFLQFTGKGTYAWMISNREKKVEKAKREKALAREQEMTKAKTTQETNGLAKVSSDSLSSREIAHV
mmetsp:Transcript_21195/g.41568  ORF Transcript_21195/g.41568 Transcript_21195/m.41568 type:complete len:254 (-) Transcript_21195:336-1097(-)|eukprot:CAMPEP_0171490792 /NCGR_PEP_ID=MMETSP0958-20121227/3504_1 /TAXON_ID=87120 /ORGANISM="Aurantiochytrium limacinum, Strain ATCCMYA-1381" /LENGTH=253 /DNA_ID=CAMNT_0012024145 /DNA_START=78 /DNA_END=839 /DNA_ORIENTATION=-